MTNQITYETKFNYGDMVYLIKEIPATMACNACDENGCIKTLTGLKITCPACKGRGIFTLDDIKTWVVIDEPFVISEIKIRGFSKTNYSVKYKVRAPFAGCHNPSELNMFSSREIAQLECDRRNRPSKRIDLLDIIIRNSWKNSLPLPEKINKCYEYYREHGILDRDIIVNKDNVLEDGYVAYLVCKMLGKENVRVILAT